MNETGDRFSLLSTERARELLRWWMDAGVDYALDDAPIDRFAKSAQTRAGEGGRTEPARSRAGSSPH